MWEKHPVPGPTKLIGGNLPAGFYGEVPAKDFITGDELAQEIGLTKGVAVLPSSDEKWLKFSYLGKIEFVSKLPLRDEVSWNHLNEVNAVFGQRTIVIHEKTYKIRLMKGKTEGLQDDQSAFEGKILHGSEWNKLMLPIHENAPSNWEKRDNVNSPTENWNIGYTDKDLYKRLKDDGEYHSVFSWCQERGDSSNSILVRSSVSIEGSLSLPPFFSFDSSGWRPVLELVD